MITLSIWVKTLSLLWLGSTAVTTVRLGALAELVEGAAQTVELVPGERDLTLLHPPQGVLRYVERALVGGRRQRVPEGELTSGRQDPRIGLELRTRARRQDRVPYETPALRRQIGSDAIYRGNHLLSA
jgi:hypothetical protein